MQFEIWKGRKKRCQKAELNPGGSDQQTYWLMIYHLSYWREYLELTTLLLHVSSLLYILIDRYLVQSAVSHLFPNQWRCLKLCLPFLVCCCVFGIVVLFSDLSLYFLTCYNVFWIIIFFWCAFAFVICYFVLRIVICFALLGHRILAMFSLIYIHIYIYIYTYIYIYIYISDEIYLTDKQSFETFMYINKENSLGKK